MALKDLLNQPAEPLMSQEPEVGQQETSLASTLTTPRQAPTRVEKPFETKVPEPAEDDKTKNIQTTVARSLAAIDSGDEMNTDIETNRTVKTLMSITSEMPTERRKYFEGELGKLQNEVTKLQTTYKEKLERTEWFEVADIIGQGLAKIGTAMYGMKHGVDMSGIQFNARDWSKDYDRLQKELDTATARVDEKMTRLQKEKDYEQEKADKSTAVGREAAMSTIKENWNRLKERRAARNEIIMQGMGADFKKLAEERGFTNDMSLQQFLARNKEYFMNREFAQDMLKLKEQYGYDLDKIEAKAAGKEAKPTEYEKTMQREQAQADVKRVSEIESELPRTEEAIGYLQNAVHTLNDPVKAEKLSGPFKAFMKSIGVGDVDLADIFASEAKTFEAGIIRHTAPMLRKMLGHQFTENETKMILGTYYRIGAPPAENAKRLQEYVTSLKQIHNDERDFVDAFHEAKGNPQKLQTLKAQKRAKDEDIRKIRAKIDELQGKPNKRLELEKWQSGLRKAALRSYKEFTPNE